MSESSSTNFKSLSSRIEISAPEVNQSEVLQRSCPENLHCSHRNGKKMEINDKR